MTKREFTFVSQSRIPSDGNVGEVIFTAHYNLKEGIVSGIFSCSEDNCEKTFKAKLTKKSTFSIKVVLDPVLNATFKH